MVVGLQYGDEEKKLEIRYEGDRFSKHTIPLSLMDDLKSVNAMILDIACEIYRKKHETKCVPRRFREEYGLSLGGIAKGSAIASLVATTSEQKHLSGTEEDECIDEAISEIMHRIAGGASTYDDLILPRVRTMGSSLKEEESMNFIRGDSVVTYNQKIRRNLIGTVEPIEIHETIYGKITEIDGNRGSFKLSVIPEKSSRRVDFDFNILPEGCGFEIKTMFGAKIVVNGTFEEKGDTKRCREIDSIEMLEPLNVEYRLLELSALKKGWGEYGDEEPPNEKRINHLIDLYDEFGSSLKNPYIYPTVDGNLEMEWKSANILSMDLDLQSLSGILFAGDEEIDIDLNRSEGWKHLILKVDENAI